METIAEFSDNTGFNCKLTKDRFYVSSLGNEETFALRGINGIGIYDDIEKYNKDLELYKNSSNIKKRMEVMNIVVGIFCLIVGLFIFKASIGFSFLLFILGIFFALTPQIIPANNTWWWGKQTVSVEPKLETYLRVMFSGGERKFLFNKNAKNAVLIANFINKLEETLTAYN